MTRVGLKAEAERCKERRSRMEDVRSKMEEAQVLTAVEQENRILA